MTQCDAFERVDKRRLSSLRCSKGFCPRKKKKRGKLEMSTLGGPRDGGGPPARALLPALQTRATPRRCPRTSTVDHDQSPSTATARSLEYPSVTTDEAQLKIRASVPTGAASNTTREDADTPTTPTTGIHATDQLLVSTTPYYAHLYPLLLRARGALHDLDRTPQDKENTAPFVRRSVI